MRILVTGATGYVGGRLVPELLAAGHDVVCLVRRPGSLDDRPWLDRVEVRIGDLLESATLPGAMAGCDVAYYLVHSMGRYNDFRRAEEESARNFRAAAEAARLARIVYLGGLGDGDLSEHLSSRRSVGRILAESSVPVTELRAAVVIGSGSLSFELLRSVTDVLPVMTTPRWVRTRCQPIAVEDLLTILRNAAEVGSAEDMVLDIGGPDTVTYQQMMRVYAREAGLLPRLIIPVPVLSPGLSSLWIGLVTPLPSATARPLVGSLRNEVTVRDNRYLRLLGRAPIPFVEAVRRALAPMGSENNPAAPLPTDPEWSGGVRYVETRVEESRAAQEDLAAEFMTIGGTKGYFSSMWAWRLRGFLDVVFGGPGLRRGRRSPDTVATGDELDFWRVEDATTGRRLALLAEMKMPGEARLEFRAEDRPGGSRLIQTAFFRPRGLLGRLYWYGLYPIHQGIFSRMARAIAAAAESPQDVARR